MLEHAPGQTTPGRAAAADGSRVTRHQLSTSGYRRFGDDNLEWLGVPRCLRDTGMPIARDTQNVQPGA